jgi:multidrug transporter EmrE-like cation transporter
MSPKDIALCAAFAIAMPMGQAFFKWAAVTDQSRAGAPLVMRLATNVPLLLALAWYGLTALVWFYILTRLPLSRAYAFALAGTGLVPIIGWLIFKEPMSWRIAVGYLLMLAGLWVVQSQGT